VICPKDRGGWQSGAISGIAIRDRKKITGRMGEVSGQSVKGENGI